MSALSSGVVKWKYYIMLVFILCNSQIIQIQMRKALVIFTKCNIANTLQHNSHTITTSGMIIQSAITV